jgi:hypothetical protein
MLGGVVGACWTNNIVDGTGTPYNTTVASQFNAKKDTFEANLESLNEWFALSESED